MDVLILPSYQASFGVPKLTTMSWIFSLVLVQGVYFVCYSVTSKEYLRLFSNLFECDSVNHCLTPEFTLLVDWFIATMSILVAFFTNELSDEVYFSYHYLYYTKMFLIYRAVLFTIFLPEAGIPLSVLVIITTFHIFTLFCLIRVLYLLFKLVESSKPDLVAIQFSFSIFSIRVVRIFKTISGTDLVVCPSVDSHISQSEICSICYDPLTFPHPRKSGSISSRTNFSMSRTKVFGNLRLFKTACNHTFHRECIMRWISGKPIRMRLGDSDPPEWEARNSSSQRANCPLCANGIELKISQNKLYLFRILTSFNKIHFSS